MLPLVTLYELSTCSKSMCEDLVRTHIQPKQEEKTNKILIGARKRLPWACCARLNLQCIEAEKSRKVVGLTSCQGLAHLVFPVLLIAISAVDWLAFGWLEWNFTFFATVSASSLVHFSRAAEATSFKTHSPSHSLVQLVIHWILLGSTIPLYTTGTFVPTRN